MKKLISFFLTVVLLVSQVSVCFARNVSTYEVLFSMDPVLIERFREGGLEDEMIQDFMGILDDEADKLQKPDDRENLEYFFLGLLFMYIFQQEEYAPVVVAFDRSFQDEVVYMAETGRIPESMELFFLSVMGNSLAYVPPEEEPELWDDSNPETEPEITPSPTPQPPFSDLAGYEWATPYISMLYRDGLISGYADGTYAPDRFMTRGELTHLIVKAFLDKSYCYDSSRFSDVCQTDWYYQDLLTAEYYSLFQWIYDKEFDSGQPVTRQELCAIVYRACRRSDIFPPKKEPGVEFLDFSEIANYAYDPISELQQSGCVSGYADGYFYPRKLATRAEAAKVIALALQLS
ncbi:MAG: S-layer homology domain-containing protein [Clostridia bacterium]|nr:S-layer homology domain-containing protein [Clostridia bacterium]